MINRNRITQLETIAGRINAPSDTEYNAASERSMTAVRQRIQAALDQHDAGIEITEYIPTAQETADSAIIQAYNKFYNIPEDTGAYDRIMHKLDLIARRMGNE